MISDLMLILYSWVIFTCLHLLIFPFIAKKCAPYLSDAGWGISRSLGWIAVGLPVWFLGHFGLPINTKVGVLGVFALGLLSSLHFVSQHQAELIKILKSIKLYIVTQEVLFLIGLVFLSLARGFQPDINGLEKFMDAGLIVAYQKSPTLPMQDMWLAGYSFNYYTFGHFLGSIATFLLGIPHQKSYNILLGFLMGLTMQMSAAFAMNALRGFQTKKSRSLPVVITGVVTGYLVAFAGTTQTIWYFLKNRTFERYWYPDATRFIERTIHEFPSYSFIVSDLHAHVWNLTNVLTLLPLIYIWITMLNNAKTQDTQKLTPGYLQLSAIMGILMGVITMTSTWDTLVYSLFFAICSVIVLIKQPKNFFKIFVTGVIVLALMIITSSPWWLHFESISEGAAIATEKSPLWQLFAIWTGHAGIGIITMTTLLVLYPKYSTVRTKGLIILAMIATGLCLLILPEFFYMKDIYTTQPRANTMFKLTYQGFIFLSLSMGWFFGFLLLNRQIPKPVQFTLYMIVSVTILTISIYPYFGYRDYYGIKITTTCVSDPTQTCFPRFTGVYKGLDGLASWLKVQEPGDYAAIEWLNKTVEGRPVIIEAVGDSYTTFARISTFSGLPTVLGWRVHEWLWRGSYDLPGKRSAEVESIYNDPLSVNSQTLLDEYQVEYVIVGNKEREAYPDIDINQLQELGKVVFEDSGTLIIQRNL